MQPRLVSTTREPASCMRPSVGAEFEPQRVHLRSADPTVHEHVGGWFAAEGSGAVIHRQRL